MIRPRLVEAAMLLEHRYTLANAAIADMSKFAGDKAFDVAFASLCCCGRFVLLEQFLARHALFRHVRELNQKVDDLFLEDRSAQ